MTRKFDVKKAQPENTYVRIALVGAAGSGKTFSALRLATGIGGKIVLIDTENRRAAKYSKRFDFEQIDFQPPFNPASYGDAIDSAIAAGAKTIIIDSMSHEHEGEGGVLEMAETFLEEKSKGDWKKREALKFASWIAPKRERTQLIVNKIQRVPVNIILCFRAKEVTKPVRNSEGKIEPIKEWDMIGGDEYRYEMDVTAFLPSGSEGVPDWSNSMKRINDADGSIKKFLMSAGQLNEDVGRKIKELTTVGVSQKTTPDPKPEPEKKPDTETQEQVTKRLAGTIVMRIRDAKDVGDVDFVMMDYSSDIETVRSASQAAYDYIILEKDKKIAGLQ